MTCKATKLGHSFRWNKVAQKYLSLLRGTEHKPEFCSPSMYMYSWTKSFRAVHWTTDKKLNKQIILQIEITTNITPKRGTSLRYNDFKSRHKRTCMNQRIKYKVREFSGNEKSIKEVHMNKSLNQIFVNSTGRLFFFFFIVYLRYILLCVRDYQALFSFWMLCFNSPRWPSGRALASIPGRDRPKSWKELWQLHCQTLGNRC